MELKKDGIAIRISDSDHFHCNDGCEHKFPKEKCVLFGASFPLMHSPNNADRCDACIEMFKGVYPEVYPGENINPNTKTC